MGGDDDAKSRHDGANRDGANVKYLRAIAEAQRDANSDGEEKARQHVVPHENIMAALEITCIGFCI